MGVQSIFPMRLRMTRNQNGMTQKELAERIGVKPATISAYESNDASKNILPSLENIVLIAKELNTSIDYLCGNDKISCTERTHVEKASDFLQAITMLYDIFEVESPAITECSYEQYDAHLKRNAPQKGYGIVFPEDSEVRSFLNEWHAIWNVYVNKSIDHETYASIIKVLCEKYSESIACNNQLPF